MYAREFTQIATPIGRVTLVTCGPVLASVTIGAAPEGVPRGTSALLDMAVEQLNSWFAGDRTDFDLPLMPAATPRGDALRQGIIAIGYGHTSSYGALARLLGSAPRAIGQACARNMFPIIVPCHRVLPGSNALGAYSAGDGATTKAWLLAHEQRQRPDPTRLL